MQRQGVQSEQSNMAVQSIVVQSGLDKSDLVQPTFLPMSKEEMTALGWDYLDILLITGDAYVDHPAFGVALLGRLLVAHGYKVGICAQPSWQEKEKACEQLLRMGRPRLFAGITAGALDSMLAHYTAFRKKRSDDAYTPGGLAGKRPNRAGIVYANLARQAFPKLPLILGGIEASLRRSTHYDFWTDSLRRSLLLDAKADVLIYGMGERAILEIATRCASEQNLEFVSGTVFMHKTNEIDNEYAFDIIYEDIPSHEDMLQDKSLLMDVTLQMERQVHQGSFVAAQGMKEGENEHHKAPFLRQNFGSRDLLIAPPQTPLNQEEMDFLYSLPFQRTAHPGYDAAIPAAEMLRTSITSHRGCGGGCAFCSLALHQSRKLSSRSAASIMEEAHNLSGVRGFSGSISDVGGPTANMWQGECTNPNQCKRSSCCHPKVCKFFHAPQKKHIDLLRKVKKLSGIKHVRVASGIRADIAMHEKEAIHAYTTEFTGGQLKIAPEHSAAEVLQLMRKPPLHIFETFLQAFEKHCQKSGKEQYVVPYLMSAYPGCTLQHMRELGAWLQAHNWKPQQVQCFIPTPGTVATAMYYTESDTEKNPIFVAKSDAERLQQHAVLIPDVGMRKAQNVSDTKNMHGTKKERGTKDIRTSKNLAHDGRKNTTREKYGTHEKHGAKVGSSGRKHVFSRKTS